MKRRRILQVSCLLSAVALSLYGFHRWPARTVSTYRNAGSEFVSGAAPVDKLLGTADYLAAALLFGVWPWIWIRGQNWKKRWRPSDEKQSVEQKLEGVAVTVSLFCAAMMGLLSLGAVISLFRS